MTLNEIGLKHGTDKATYHSYLEFYESILNPIKAKIFNMLELGIYHGDSLRMWAEWLPDANIYGVDINLSQIQGNVGRCNIEPMNLSDPRNLSYYLEQKKYHKIIFDLIVDDASHHCDHQISAFKVAWNYLNDGGVYIVEDVNTSFPSYGKLYGGDGVTSPFINKETFFDFMESEYFKSLNVASFAFWHNENNPSDDSWTVAITKTPLKIKSTRFNYASK
jgi:hypothetical protein